MSNTNILSYASLVKGIEQFKRSGTKTGSEFNMFDFPSHKYFKILFYFGGLAEDETSGVYSSGLLAPTWEYEIGENEYYKVNSAWAYLKNNDENERAEKLEKFVNLLSNINSESPWYFNSIGGIQEALDRKPAENEDKFELGEQKKLTITCLPDAFDNRISTLLELYRDITWSWYQKKQILPANLRKFDMAVYVFESQIADWHKVYPTLSLESVKKEDDLNLIIGTNTGFITSYKLLEFHNCEINYNSIKSGWSELNNQTGVTPTYTIDISYDDCYEISYNEHMMRKIGDVIATDISQAIINDGIINNSNFESIAQTDSERQKYHLDLRTNIYSHNKDVWGDNFASQNGISKNIEDYDNRPKESYIDPNKKGFLTGFVENAANQVVGHLKADIQHWVKRAYLGNLYGVSLSHAVTQLKDIANGDLVKTGMTVAQYVKDAENKKNAKIAAERELGQLPNYDAKETTKSELKDLPNYDAKETTKSELKDLPNYDAKHSTYKANGNIFAAQALAAKKIKANKLGNIFDNSTIANN